MFKTTLGKKTYIIISSQTLNTVCVHQILGRGKPNWWKWQRYNQPSRCPDKVQSKIWLSQQPIVNYLTRWSLEKVLALIHNKLEMIVKYTNTIWDAAIPMTSREIFSSANHAELLDKAHSTQRKFSNQSNICSMFLVSWTSLALH
jgi:hypothetical protein